VDMDGLYRSFYPYVLVILEYCVHYYYCCQKNIKKRLKKSAHIADLFAL
jgi:hypothetical protein